MPVRVLARMSAQPVILDRMSQTLGAGVAASDARGADAPAPPMGNRSDSAQAGLLGPAQVRGLTTALGLRPTKALGQNFVRDAGTVRRIARRAGVRPGETILEIGPGLGSLTLALLEAGARVLAVEIDPVLARALPVTVADRMPGAADRLRVVQADALALDGLGALGLTSADPAPTRLVANLPYNVAVPVLLHLFAQFPSIRHALVMVQDEVADRLAAKPGSKIYGVPSVKASWYAEVFKAGVIGKNVFWPAPKINSGLVGFRMRPQPLADIDRDEVFTVIDAAFAQRRKTLRAALASWAGSGARAEAILTEAGITPTERGEKLDIHGYIRIAQAAHRVPALAADEN